MGIDVAWVNEEHEPKLEVYDPQQRLTQLATSSWPKLANSVSLRFIDVFGDSVFNQAQIPVLLKELNDQLSISGDAEVRRHLEKVIHLIERASGKTHTYIKFTGD